MKKNGKLTCLLYAGGNRGSKPLKNSKRSLQEWEKKNAESIDQKGSICFRKLLQKMVNIKIYFEVNKLQE